MMTPSPNGSVQPRKLLAAGAIKIRIAVAAAVVLATGAWLAPRSPQKTGLTAPQERAAPLLEEQVQLREPSRPFIGLHDVASSVAQYSVTILPPPSPAIPSRNDYAEPRAEVRAPAGYGVFVSATHVLTYSAALDGRSTAELTMSGRLATRAQLIDYEPATGLVLLGVEQADDREPAPLAADAPSPGDLAVAVGRSDRRDMAVPVFITSVGPDEYTVGAASEELLPGMPIFNLAGEVIAIAAPDGGRTRGIPARQAADRLLARATAGNRRSSFGLGYQEPTGHLADAFGRDGVVITEVVAGGPGDAADLRIGDVLLAVGEVKTDSVESTARALSTALIGTPTALRIRRGTRLQERRAVASSAYDVAALRRWGVDVAPTLEARALFPPAVLQASAIPPSARVLSVNGRPATTREQVQRVRREARRPIPVLLRIGSDQFFVSLDAPR